MAATTAAPVAVAVPLQGGFQPTPLDLYNMAVSLLTGIGLLYLLYSGRYVVNYRRFFQIIAVGLFVALLGGSFLFFLSNAMRHAIHGIATMVIAVGLYDLVRNEVPGRNVDWTVVLYSDPREKRGLVDEAVAGGGSERGGTGSAGDVDGDSAGSPGDGGPAAGTQGSDADR